MEENNPAQSESIEDIAKQTEEPVSPPPPPSSIPSKPFYKNKFFYLFALSFLLIAFLIGGFTLGKNSSKPTPTPTPQAMKPTTTPTPDPITANWKTYASSNYGFEIKYPLDFVIKLDSGSDVEIYKSGTDVPHGEGGFEWPRLIIQPGQTLSEFDTQYSNAKNSNKFALSDKNTGSNIISLTSGNKKFYFNCYLYQAPADIKVCDQMLSTFKFTNSTDEIANWITYISASEPTLSFKHPPSWALTKTISAPNPNANPNVPQETESVKLTSKNGTEIDFAVGGNYVGGACSDTVTNAINQVTPLPKANGLYLIDISRGQEEMMGIDSSSVKVGSVSDCATPHLIFSSKSNQNKQIIFYADKPNMADKVELTNMLESLTY